MIAVAVSPGRAVRRKTRIAGGRGRGLRMEIRSYRAVFDLERRIYRIDRLRLNPAGVPVRGIVYFLALLAAIAGLRERAATERAGRRAAVVSRCTSRCRARARRC